jgi:hypothetical protein
MSWRTHTPRTLREAFGPYAKLHEDHPALRWPRPELLFTVTVSAICAWLFLAHQEEPARLKAAGCEYVAPSMDRQHIWHCRDGWRVNDTPGDAL